MRMVGVPHTDVTESEEDKLVMVSSSVDLSKQGKDPDFIISECRILSLPNWNISGKVLLYATLKLLPTFSDAFLLQELRPGLSTKVS